MRHAKTILTTIVTLGMLVSWSTLARTLPVAADQPLIRCPLRADYADKRPYESPHSDPFFAAFIEQDIGVRGEFRRSRDIVRAPARLVVRTESGLFEKVISRQGATEFTLPTHESVTAAWIDAVARPDGTLERCDPSGAFFVDGYHDVAFTKLVHQQELGDRELIGKATHLPDLFLAPLEPLTTLRNPGRRPAGSAIAAATPCNEPERGAQPLSDVAVAFDEPAGADRPPSLVVDVSPLGAVMSVDINRPSGSHTVDVAMLDAAAKQRFAPARWHCTNVPDRVIVPVWFSSPSPPATKAPLR